MKGASTGAAASGAVRSRRGRCLAVLGMTATLGLGAPSTAWAQNESILIQPDIPMDYGRGRNVSVRERPRPDYDPLGIRAGGFIVLPSVQAGAGYSDNASQSSGGDGDGFAYVSPQVKVNSDWSRHRLMVTANTRILRYFDQSQLNQAAYDLGSSGRLDLGSDFALSGEARIGKLYESPTDGEINSDVAVLSHYRRINGGVRAELSTGRFRYIANVDYNAFEFSDIDLPGGGVRRQFDRDRDVVRLNGRVEYALSPSFSLYGQLSYDKIDYDSLLQNGDPNRDSDSARVLAGVSMDLQGLLRGVIGIGYAERSYKSPIYKDAQGLSLGARVEYFFSELTTFTMTANRSIRDANFSSSAAYYDNRFSFRADHELLRNMIISGYAEYAKIDYIDAPLKNDTYRLIGSGTYMASRTLALDFSAGFAKQSSNAAAVTGRFDEFRLQIGVTLQR